MKYFLIQIFKTTKLTCYALLGEDNNVYQIFGTDKLLQMKNSIINYNIKVKRRAIGDLVCLFEKGEWRLNEEDITRRVSYSHELEYTKRGVNHENILREEISRWLASSYCTMIRGEALKGLGVEWNTI